jgi:transposase
MDLIEEIGCKLLYLPPYSPDFNSVEEAFAKVKGSLGRFGARTYEPPGGGDGQGARYCHGSGCPVVCSSITAIAWGINC